MIAALIQTTPITAGALLLAVEGALVVLIRDAYRRGIR